MKKRWPIWRTILAYCVMFLLAIAAIIFVDRKVQPANFPISIPNPPTNK